jgi:hypothetical protein
MKSIAAAMPQRKPGPHRASAPTTALVTLEILEHMHDSDDWFVDDVFIQELALTEKQVHRAMKELERFNLVEVAGVARLSQHSETVSV